MDVKIDPSRLALSFVEGAHVGRVSIAVFFFNEREPGGGNMEDADIELADDVYKKVLGSGIPYRVTYAVNPGVRRVRVVVYAFKADLIGSADTSVL